MHAWKCLVQALLRTRKKSFCRQQQRQADARSGDDHAHSAMLCQQRATDKKYQPQFEAYVGNDPQANRRHCVKGLQLAQPEQAQAGKGDGVDIGQPGDQRDQVQAAAAGNMAGETTALTMESLTSTTRLASRITTTASRLRPSLFLLWRA